jgi:hypothetical protein
MPWNMLFKGKRRKKLAAAPAASDEELEAVIAQ